MLKILLKKILLPPCHGWVARPWFQSFPKPLFQSKAKCKASDIKMSFYSDEDETHYHKKVLLLASFWTVRFLEFGSGLLSNELMMRDFCRKEQSWLSKDGVLGKLIFNFKTYYKARQCVITIHDSSAYYNLRQRVITICDSLVVTILDNCYYNLRPILQFTTLLQFTTEQSSP